MYGPGSPFNAWKHRDVSSMTTGQPAGRKEIKDRRKIKEKYVVL